jgi:uncharacterized protein
MKTFNKKLITKDTGKYGKGVFAREDIKKGEILHVLNGKKLDLNDVVDKVLSGKEAEDDPLQTGRRTYIDLDEFSRTFNHSCNPNGGIRKISELFALRDIKSGEQITYDYSLTIAPTIWKMKCKCGSKNCRKVLGDVLSVPPKRRAEYKKVGAFQNYMKSLLKEIENGKHKMPQYEKLALEKLNHKITK